MITMVSLILVLIVTSVVVEMQSQKVELPRIFCNGSAFKFAMLTVIVIGIIEVINSSININLATSRIDCMRTNPIEHTKQECIKIVKDSGFKHEPYWLYE